MRLDENRYVYLEVADTPLVATSLRWSGDDALLGLTDGSEEALDPRTLTADDGGLLRCSVRQGRLRARLSTSAAATLSERIVEGVEGLVVRVGREEMVIAREVEGEGGRR